MKRDLEEIARAEILHRDHLADRFAAALDTAADEVGVQELRLVEALGHKVARHVKLRSDQGLGRLAARDTVKARHEDIRAPRSVEASRG